MKSLVTLAALVCLASSVVAQTTIAPPIGVAGRTLHFRHTRDTGLAASVVRDGTLRLGQVETIHGRAHQWIELRTTNADGRELTVWWLADTWPLAGPEANRAGVARYLVREAGRPVVEYRDGLGEGAVLPSLVDWRHLLPQAVTGDHEGSPFVTLPAPERLRHLGHDYRLVTAEDGKAPKIPAAERGHRLFPGLFIGLPSNQRQKDETRRYDGTDYQYVRLDAADYRRMVEAGVTCLRVDKDQLPAVESLDAFYWGVSPADLPFPEFLYRSCYLGPGIFLDEPAVTTRDSVLRPRLGKEPEFRRSITPAAALQALDRHYEHLLRDAAPVQWRRSLAGRPDVDLGTVDWPQANLYSWETMIASSAWQLRRAPESLAAVVFEPPGRIGSRRTLPEFNMSYGCQLPVEDPAAFTGVLFGFLRGAARAADRSWGVSIYGALDRADGPWYFTHAWDLGATHFFFWDNYQLACVPFGECLTLARHLRSHAESHPRRNPDRLRRAAETVILLPPGYDLGHVHTGRGSFWGLGELNLERANAAGVKYRVVMAGFFGEIERAYRLGAAFDLLWDLPGIPLAGYREVVRVREDGSVEVSEGNTRQVHPAARPAARPAGEPPRLEVTLSAASGQAPLELTARATVTETTAPVWYTTGADPSGVLHNAAVSWELFGPGDEDWRPLGNPAHRPGASFTGNVAEATLRVSLGRPGRYRLRAATSDLAGRTSIRWVPIEVSP